MTDDHHGRRGKLSPQDTLEAAEKLLGRATLEALRPLVGVVPNCETFEFEFSEENVPGWGDLGPVTVTLRRGQASGGSPLVSSQVGHA